jgi:hypothetical protein
VSCLLLVNSSIALPNRQTCLLLACTGDGVLLEPLLDHIVDLLKTVIRKGLYVKDERQSRTSIATIEGKREELTSWIRTSRPA